jgi:putative oxidoreductase
VKRLLDTRPDATLTWLRLVLGLIMLPHGAQKLLGLFGGSGYSSTVAFFESQLGLPPAVTLLVILTESFGALLLIFGLGGRFAALALIGNMVGAMIVVNAANGFFWTAQGYEFPLFVSLVAAVILVRGSGAWSLDRLLAAGTVAERSRVAAAAR